MTRERDSQRTRLYRAENEAAVGRRRFADLDEVEDWLERCMSHRWFDRHFPMIQRPIVENGRGRTFATGGLRSLRPVMKLPRWALTRGTVLHEFAHALTDLEALRQQRDVPWAAHGWQFARNYLALVRHFCGAVEGERLRLAFRDHKVRYYPPRASRKLTPEQRAAACARLAEARARREEGA